MNAFSFQDGPWTLWIEDDQWFIFCEGQEWWRSKKENTKRFKDAMNRFPERISGMQQNTR